MPIYEFQCKTCQFCFEEILPASREDIPPCPRCDSSENVVRLVSACVAQTGRQSGSACAPAGGFS
jgi:putative FmdB family regulatory protein